MEASSLALPDRAWGEPERPVRAAGVPLNGFLDIGRRIIGALLMAEGVEDIAYSVAGSHANLFWFPLMHDSFLPGMAFIAIGIGIWRAHAWARLLCGALSLLSWITVGISYPAMVVLHPVVGQGPRAIAYFLLFSVPSGALAVYCFMPTIRKQFAQVREARSRPM